MTEFTVLWVDPNISRLRLPTRLPCPNGSHSLHIEKCEDPEQAMNRLTFDDPEVNLILLRSIFDNRSEDEIFALLDRIRQMDPDIPIVIMSQSNSGLDHASGRVNAEVLGMADPPPDLDQAALVNRLVAKIRDRVSTYDITQRILANAVADRYEALETQRPGTVAYWLFEEDLIKRIVNEKEERVKRGARTQLEVLDVGCGTGRLARTILQHSTTARVTCVDFSGKMLAEARRRLNAYMFSERCVLRRALAEKLPEELKKKKFDIVLLGFGFPSYTPTAEVLREASGVLADDGLLFASSYNHCALAYDRWTGHAHEDDPDRPISTWIDREKGEIWIRTKTPVPSKLRTRTYTVGYFARELRHAGYQVGGYLTFPVLYSVLRCSQIADWVEPNPRDKCYENQSFSFKLWDADRELSRHLKDKGFYAVFLASKSDVAVEVARQLQFHTGSDLPILQA